MRIGYRPARGNASAFAQWVTECVVCHKGMRCRCFNVNPWVGIACDIFGAMCVNAWVITSVGCGRSPRRTPLRFDLRNEGQSAMAIRFPGAPTWPPEATLFGFSSALSVPFVIGHDESLKAAFIRIWSKL